MPEKDFLRSVRAKKFLGQTFLIDQNIINKIIKNSSLSKKDFILEIGAGTGGLTLGLAKEAKFVFALEIDKELCTLLKQRTKGYANIKIINKDILNFSLSTLKPRSREGLKVVANIPYYIATRIIEYLFKNRNFFKEIYLTIQKELAKRIIASPGTRDYSSLSCFVQFYAKPEILFTVKRNSFFLRPKVDSVFLKLTLFKKPRFKVKDKKLFFKLIRTAFNMRRKNILNSLSPIISKDKLKGLLDQLKIDPHLRAENLTLEDFVTISNSISYNKNI